jgi:hypothetical protein
MKTAMWVVLGLAVLLVLCTGLALGAGLLGYGSFGGMMGTWGGNVYPGNMMGGWGWGIGGLLGMALMALMGIVFLALLVLGIVWLVRQATPPSAQPPVTGAECPSCHKGVQADWKNCPSCGKTLKT